MLFFYLEELAHRTQCFSQFLWMPIGVEGKELKIAQGKQVKIKVVSVTQL